MIASEEGVVTSKRFLTLMTEKVTERRTKLFAVKAVKEIIEIKAKMRFVVRMEVIVEVLVKVVIVVIVVVLSTVSRVELEVRVEVFEELIEVKVLTTAGREARALFVAELVIASAFVGVGQDFVGHRDLPELVLSVFGLILVGVILKGQLAERLLYVPFGGIPRDAQQLVVVLRGHHCVHTRHQQNCYRE